ncbi:MAG: hypothetical protein L0H29_03230, partial [Sinobacteraceae bacterium]|nr:hypothetical protein [Nevskiaceae bacterium]
EAHPDHKRAHEQQCQKVEKPRQVAHEISPNPLFILADICHRAPARLWNNQRHRLICAPCHKTACRVMLRLNQQYTRKYRYPHDLMPPGGSPEQPGGVNFSPHLSAKSP